MQLGLRAKLKSGFGVLLMLLVLTGGFSYFATRNLISKAEDANQALEKKQFATFIELGLRKAMQTANDFTFTGDEAAVQRYAQNQQELKQELERLGSSVGTDRGKVTYGRIQQAAADVLAITDQEIALRRASRNYEATDLAFGSKAEAAENALATSTAALEQMQDDLVQTRLSAEHSSESEDDAITLALVLAGLLIGVLTAVLIGRSIAEGMSRMLAVIQEIAANNLVADDLQVFTEDEIGHASGALNRMKNNLRDIVHAIAGTAEHVASASEELSSSASLQATGAATQRDQASQVATAMQEMSSTVLQVSENSARAADASRQAAEKARHGGRIVEDALSKMRSIAASVEDTARKVESLGKSSDQIGHIIGVIDDIADQTNLLALNAAIEAARAGEQGRGFAVVADEVRKLAERTTSATKEIAQMIRTIQAETKTAVSAMEGGTLQVEAGVASTVEAGDSLKEIITVSEQVGDMINHIATAATEQSSATEEINHSVEQIARLVKESADGADQSAKACQDLSALALDLQKIVSNFRLGSRPSTQLGFLSKPRETSRAFAASAR